MGFDQAISWGLISPAVFDLLRLDADDARRSAVRVSNPLSEELSVMRTTLLGGLLDAARRNLAHGMERASLFESGPRVPGRGAARRRLDRGRGVPRRHARA